MPTYNEAAGIMSRIVNKKFDIFTASWVLANLYDVTKEKALNDIRQFRETKLARPGEWRRGKKYKGTGIHGFSKVGSGLKKLGRL